MAAALEGGRDLGWCDRLLRLDRSERALAELFAGLARQPELPVPGGSEEPGARPTDRRVQPGADAAAGRQTGPYTVS